MKIRYLVLFFVFAAVAFAQFCIPQLPLAYAQGEEDEEEEEPIQARPNPMESYTKGASKRGVSRGLKTTATQAVGYDGVDGESMPIDPYGAQAGAEGTSMPIDPLGAQAGADSTAGVSMTTENGVGSASWDPTDSPAGWDPFDKEANLDSAEMHQ